MSRRLLDFLFRRNKIHTLHIEASSNCQAKCPMCPRTGLEGLVVSDLKLDWFKKNIKPKKYKKIFFCGNLGDPCANKDLVKICKWIKSKNENIVLGVNTNGALQSAAWWEELAGVLTGVEDYVVFSIDGLEETNEKYRIDVNWDSVLRNAYAFIRAGGSAHWDMLVFAHNAHEVELCKKFAKRIMGFRWFRAKETTRWHLYPEGICGLYPVNDDWKNVKETEIKCEAQYSRFFDAQGNEWPCCHMAEAYIMSGNKDIKKFSNTELLDNYNERLKTNPYDICKKACGTTSRTSQWKQEIEFYG